jgi:aldehyde dehydrogenase (NAD+)
MRGHFQAYKTTWGLHCPGTTRGKLLAKLADIMEAHRDELAALEALDVGASNQNELINVFIDAVCDIGKTYQNAKEFDLHAAISSLRYYAGWADKIHGHTIEVSLIFLCAEKINS